jgi:hypothetical protein
VACAASYRLSRRSTIITTWTCEFQTFAGGFVGSGGGFRTDAKRLAGDTEWQFYFLGPLSGLGSFKKLTTQSPSAATQNQVTGQTTKDKAGKTP